MGSLSDSPPALLKTALNAAHRRLGARMVDFSGWDMPVQYPTGILAEHQAVRTACGIFDLSHMGRVYVRGPDAMVLAQECCTRDLSRIPSGQAAYSVLCDVDGGILDDVIAYVLDAHDILFVFNASNRLSDAEWFQTVRDGHNWRADIDDRTLETALIGVQGPDAQAVLQATTSADLEPMPGYAFTRTSVCGVPALVARTGYTGEDGFEVMLNAQAAESVWTRLSEAATPCGLGARDTLRTEAGFALYGHEIDRSTNPFVARLSWVVNLAKPSFVGRDALERVNAAGPQRRLVGLRVAPGGVARAGTPILRDDVTVGGITSGTFSPTLKVNIAMGYVPTELSRAGQQLSVEVRGKPIPAELTALPFVAHRSRPRATM